MVFDGLDDVVHGTAREAESSARLAGCVLQFGAGSVQACYRKTRDRDCRQLAWPGGLGDVMGDMRDGPGTSPVTDRDRVAGIGW